MITDKYKLRILDLAQRWRMGLLTPEENSELEIWFKALEDQELGLPTELSVERLEKRLHQLMDAGSTRPDQSDAPPYPFK